MIMYTLYMYHSGYAVTNESTQTVLYDDQRSGLLQTLTHPPDTSLRSRAELESISDQVNRSVSSQRL